MAAEIGYGRELRQAFSRETRSAPVVVEFVTVGGFRPLQRASRGVGSRAAEELGERVCCSRCSPPDERCLQRAAQRSGADQSAFERAEECQREDGDRDRNFEGGGGVRYEERAGPFNLVGHPGGDGRMDEHVRKQWNDSTCYI